MNVVNGIDTTPEALRFLEGTEARLEAVLAAGGGEVSHSDTLLNAGRHLCVGSGGKRLRPMMEPAATSAWAAAASGSAR